MKILISAGLANRTLQQFLIPISKVESVEEIIVVRDRIGDNLDKVKYVTVPKFIAKNPILKTMAKFALICGLTIKYKPDLLHGFLMSPDGLLCYYAGKIFRRKNGISLIAGPVELYMFGGSPIEKYHYMDDLPKLNTLGKINLKRLKKSDIITTTGTFTRDFLIDKGLNPEKIVAIKHLPHFVEKGLKPKKMEKEYDLIFIGRLERVKHVETIIKAIPLIKKKYANIKLAIVGIGGHMDYLQKLTTELKITENVEFLGYQENIWDLFNKAKISIVTSEREGCPLSAYESMACGIPVIAAKCGDIKDLIYDDINGIFISRYDDYIDLAKKAIELLEDDKKIETLSKNALKTMEGINVEVVSKEWKKVFKSAGLD